MQTSSEIISSIFSGAWQTIQHHWRKLVVIVLFLRVGGWAITYGVSTYLSELPIDISDNQILVDPSLVQGKSVIEIWQIFQPFVLTILIITLIALTVLLISQIMVTKLALDAAEGKKMPIQELLQFSRKRFGPYVGTSFLQSIYLFFLYMLLIIPGVIYSVYRLFTTLDVVYTDRSYKAAMDESKRLVKGRRWKTLAWLLLIVFSVGIIQVLLNYIFGFIPDAMIAEGLITLLGRTVQVIMMILMAQYYLAWRKTVKQSPVTQDAEPPTQ